MMLHILPILHGLARFGEAVLDPSGRLLEDPLQEEDPLLQPLVVVEDLLDQTMLVRSPDLIILNFSLINKFSNRFELQL
jgi:hypothetical protein